MFYFYDFKFGRIILDDSYKNVEDAITYIGDRKATALHIEELKYLKHFMGYDCKNHQAKNNAKKIFTDFIPRVLGKDTEIMQAETFEEAVNAKIPKKII